MSGGCVANLPARRIASLGAALVALVLSTGCFTTRTVRGEALPVLQSPTDEAVVLPGADGPDTRLGPSSMIRLRRPGGHTSRWFAARNLRVRPEGLSVTTRTVPFSTVREARVIGLSPEHALLLEGTAPDGAALEHLADGTIVLHPASASLPNWISRFVEARAGAGGPIADAELWRLVAGYEVATLSLPGAALQSASREGIRVVDGLPWADITAMEVKNLDGFMTWFTVVSSPLWVTGIIAIGALGGNFGDVSVDASTELSDANAHPGVPEEQALTDLEVQAGGVLGQGRGGPLPSEGWQPLFSDSALRKARIRPMVWTGLGGELTTGRSSNLLLGAGIRAWDVAELGIGTNSWWADPFGLGPNLPGVPLAPGPPRYVPYLMVYLRAGADFDLEATRRVTLPLAANLGYGTDATWQFRLQWGARVRIVQGVFIGVHPFNPQFTSAKVGGTSSWSFPSFVEIGSTF